jgi:radical SAM-linked protein
MTGDKLRFRFAKTGHLRLLSHHDLMRCFERMLRRADVPFKSTAGFHPGPRVVFALSLPLGVIGRDEAVEVELTRPCDAEETLARLNAQAPDGLAFTRVSVVPMKATAIPRRVVYTLPLPAERVAETERLADELVRAEKVWVDRLRPSPKRLNIRPYVRELAVAGGDREVARLNPLPAGERVAAQRPCEGSHAHGNPVHVTPHPHPLSPPGRGGQDTDDLAIVARLTLDLWVTQTGTARADELVRLLDLTDLLDGGAVLSRDVLELRDEVTDPADNPPDGPAETRPLDPAAVAAPVRDEEANQPAAAHWGASPNGPVVE